MSFGRRSNNAIADLLKRQATETEKVKTNAIASGMDSGVRVTDNTLAAQDAVYSTPRKTIQVDGGAWEFNPMKGDDTSHAGNWYFRPEGYSGDISRFSANAMEGLKNDYLNGAYSNLNPMTPQEFRQAHPDLTTDLSDADIMEKYSGDINQENATRAQKKAELGAFLNIPLDKLESSFKPLYDQNKTFERVTLNDFESGVNKYLPTVAAAAISAGTGVLGGPIISGVINNVLSNTMSGKGVTLEDVARAAGTAALTAGVSEYAKPFKDVTANALTPYVGETTSNIAANTITGAASGLTVNTGKNLIQGKNAFDNLEKSLESGAIGGLATGVGQETGSKFAGDVTRAAGGMAMGQDATTAGIGLGMNSLSPYISKYSGGLASGGTFTPILNQLVKGTPDRPAPRQSARPTLNRQQFNKSDFLANLKGRIGGQRG